MYPLLEIRLFDGVFVMWYTPGAVSETPSFGTAVFSWKKGLIMWGPQVPWAKIDQHQQVALEGLLNRAQARL